MGEISNLCIVLAVLEPANTLVKIPIKNLCKTYRDKIILVALVHLNWNNILQELSRWKQLSRERKELAYSTGAD